MILFLMFLVYSDLFQASSHCFFPFCFSPLSSLILPGLFIAGKDDYAIDIFSFGICALEVRKADHQRCFLQWLLLLFLTDYLLLQMAVLEIQANGDTPVSKEAIAHAGQSLEDPLMRVSHTSTRRYHGNMPNDWPKSFFFFYHRPTYSIFTIESLSLPHNL